MAISSVDERDKRQTITLKNRTEHFTVVVFAILMSWTLEKKNESSKQMERRKGKKKKSDEIYCNNDIGSKAPEKWMGNKRKTKSYTPLVIDKLRRICISHWRPCSAHKFHIFSICINEWRRTFSVLREYKHKFIQ